MFCEANSRDFAETRQRTAEGRETTQDTTIVVFVGTSWCEAWRQIAWDQIPASPFISHVILGRLLIGPVLQFPNLQIVDNKSPPWGLLGELSKLILL